MKTECETTHTLQSSIGYRTPRKVSFKVGPLFFGLFTGKRKNMKKDNCPYLALTSKETSIS